MPTWLLLQADLRFNPKLKSIFPQSYRPDLLPEGSDVYYGVHFVSAPAEIRPGDQLLVELLVRAYPEHPCSDLQPGRKIFLKEGSLVRAEGTITRRWVREISATNVLSALEELAKLQPDRQ